MATRWRWPPENSCGIALGGVGLEPDLDQRLVDAPAGVLGVFRQAMHLQPLADDLGDRQPRRQARKRVLEDDLHLAAQRPQLPLRFVRDLASGKADVAVGLDQPQQRQAERGLARAAFADHPQVSCRRGLLSDTPSTALTWPVTRRSRPLRIGNHTLTALALDQHRRVGGSAGCGRPFGSAASRWRV